MKTSFAIIMMLFSLALFSCLEKKAAIPDQQDSTISYPADNLDTDFYSPGEGWELNWSDEFNSNAIDTNNWNFQVLEAGTFNDEWQRYTDSKENAYIDQGCLVIKAIQKGDTHGMDQYTSARLNTANQRSWQYGKIAARIQLPYTEGIWPAFWMLGANIDENGGDTPWPQSGEIDIMEFYGSRDDAVVEANIHYADSTDTHAYMGAASYRLPEGIFADAFHTFELEWDADTISWMVDGHRYASTPIDRIDMTEFHQEYFILLNMAVGNQYAGRPDTTSVFPQYMYVDWVRVYQKEEE